MSGEVITLAFWLLLGIWFAEVVLLGIPLLAFALLLRLGVLRQASRPGGAGPCIYPNSPMSARPAAIPASTRTALPVAGSPSSTSASPATASHQATVSRTANVAGVTP